MYNDRSQLKRAHFFLESEAIGLILLYFDLKVDNEERDKGDSLCE